MPKKSRTSAKKNKQLPDNKEILQRGLRQLRIKWTGFCSATDKGDTLDRFYSQVEELAEATDSETASEFNDDAMELEVYLCSFIDTGQKPNPQQQEVIEKLLTKLESSLDPDSSATASATGVSETSAESPPEAAAPNLPEVIMLSRGGDSIPGLIQLIQQSKYRITRCETVAAARDACSNQIPSVLIIDGSVRREFEQIPELLENLKSPERQRVPVVLISDPDDLSRNLAAMRVGADAYFGKGSDPQLVAAYLKTLVSPDEADPYRVMIVDDNADQAGFAEKILQKAGMETRSVTDSLQTLRILKEFKPDLILMDIYMPGADGLELTRIIRGHSKFSSIPIVFVSGEQDPEKQFEVLTVGGDDFLPKPIRPRHLISAVTNRVRRARDMQLRLGETRDSRAATSLLGRRSFLERVQGALESKLAEEGNGGILYVSLDSAHELENRLGIHGIEELISRIGDLLSLSLESADVAAHLGNGNFAVLAFRQGGSEIVAYAEELRYSIADQLFEIEGMPVDVTASIGLCLFSRDEETAPDLIFRAEQASEFVRENGGNRSHVYVRRENDTVPANRDSLDEALIDLVQEALETNGFRVLFQPMAALRGDAGRRYQALLRLRDRTGGLIAAAKFIPVAERADLILAIDRWIAGYITDLLLEQKAKGKAIRLFASQSAASLREPVVLDWLRKGISSGHLCNEGLVLEFKFVDVEAHLQKALSYLNALKELDVQISLAGYGADPASVKLLDRVPADFLRAASEFNGPRAGELPGLVKAAHERDMKVIVPMVEDARGMAAVWQSGADFVQGRFVQSPDQNLDFDFSGSVL